VIFHPIWPGDADLMRTIRARIASEPPLRMIPANRARFDDFMLETPSADVAYERAELGGVRGWWVRPRPYDSRAAILHLHGGGYVIGSADSQRRFASQIAARAGVPAFVVDYRRAPEYPFPAALDDAEAVFGALAAAGYEQIALVGDSAGGGLALAVMTATHNRCDPHLAGAVVFSPWTDLALTGESLRTRAAVDPLLSREWLDEAAALYLGTHDRRDPQVSPLYAELTDMPPVLVHVGDDEVLLDDSTRLGSAVELHVWQGMTHVFSVDLGLTASHEALDSAGAFLRACFGYRTSTVPTTFEAPI
jgi:acetyl esterase/lipase